MSLIAAAFLLLALPVAQAAPGERDRLYGTAGIARDGSLAFIDGGERVLSQPDGKVVMVGFRRAASGADTNRKLSVWRFNSDASRDTGFGAGNSGQSVLVISGASDEVGAAALQPDGKILVAGSRVLPPINGGKPSWLVMRLTASGDLDVGFGGSGTRDYVIDANATLQRIESMALQPDGSILLGGYPNALMRVASNGAIDLTFGSNGVVRPPFDGDVTGIAVQADGKILVSGGVSGGNPGASVMRFNADGSLDSSFATGGSFLLPSMIAKGLSVQPDGGILFGFSDNPNGGSGYFALRLLGDGTRDMAFGNSGVASFLSIASVFYAMSNRIPVAADGSFALGGASPAGGFTLARFAANGQPHPMFAGYAGTPFGGRGNAADVALQADGKALLTGFTPLSTTEAMVVRINTAGALDTAFNDAASPVAGIAAMGLDCAGNAFPGGIAAASSGGVYLAYGGGCSNGGMTLVKLDPTGQIDTGFSGGFNPGSSSFFFSGNATISRAVAVQPDGFVVVAGSINPAGTRDFALARVSPTGIPDATFGASGKVLFSPSAGADELYALAVQPDGKILAAGSAGSNGVVVRFNANGNVDSGFAGGVVTIPGARVNVMALHDGGGILAGVTTTSGGSALVRLTASGQVDTAFGVSGSVTTPEQSGVLGIAVLSDGAIVAAGVNWIRKWSASGMPRGFSATAPTGVQAMAATAGDRILLLVPSGAGAVLRRLLSSGAEDAAFVSGNVLAGLVNGGALGMAAQGASVFVAGQKVDGYVPAVIVDNQVSSTPTIPEEYLLEVFKTGNGQVVGSTIDCGPICAATFNRNTFVTLTATPSANSTFAGWTGACQNTVGPCIVEMIGARNVAANFVGQQFQLNVDFSSTGNGTVTSVPAGVNCTTLCQTNFDVDTVVTLTATPLAGSRFAGWSGDCTNATGTCTVTMNRASLVVARFEQIPLLTITRTGSGSGVVSSSPTGIACGSTCSFEFGFDTVVTLTATADSGSAFVGWSGPCSGSFGPCTLTMNVARTVSANFTTGMLSFTLTGPPPPHDYTAVSGTLSDSRFFVLTNTGNLTLQGITPEVVPNGFLWFAGTSCGTTLAPGASCNINLTLAPPPGTTAVQVNSTFRVLIANAGSSADIPVAGTVLLPTVTATPATLDFSALAGGVSAPQTVSFVSNGALAHAAPAIANSVFQIVTENCSRAFLAAGTPCTVSLRYVPSALSGSNGGQLSLIADTNFGASLARSTLGVAPLQGVIVPTIPLTVTKSGTGSGTITSAPAGIDCGATCSANFAAGSMVTLTAIPDGGSSFAGWSGACNGTGSCVVTMSAAKGVTATFNVPQFTVTVGPSAGGRVTSSPAGIDCPGTCSASFAAGSTVTLTPLPDANFAVDGWAGCPGATITGPCAFTLNANVFMNLGFRRVAVNITVLKVGFGTGTVTSAQAGGIACGPVCTVAWPFAAAFQLLPGVADAGSVFSGFSGGGCSGTGACTMDTGFDRTITATFDSANPVFTVTNTATSGAGSFANVLSTIYNAASDVCLPGTKTIAFNIPAATDPGCNAATGICSIPLPNTPSEQNIRCGDIIIDGYTQPGAAPNTASDRTNNAQIKIELGANLTGNFAGAIAIGRATTHPFGNFSANNVTIRGIAFPRHSLLLRTGNSGSIPHGGSGHVVAGNVFGWHADGTAAVTPISEGIHLYGAYLSSAVIGGPNPADRNMLTNPSSANALGIRGDGVANVLFEGNYINIGRNGAPVAAAGMTGIRIWQDNGNNTPPSINNVIRRNVMVSGNSGPVFTGTGGGNTVTENILFGHPAGVPAINFFSLAGGGTNPQLPPVVTSVSVQPSQTHVSGSVSGNAGGTIRLEFFSNPTAYTGNGGQADTFHGNLDVVMDASGQGSFSKVLPAGVQHVGVTATRLSTGDTSMFSNYLAPVAQSGITITLAGTGSGTVTSVPAGIVNCPSSCSGGAVPGALVQLIATPAADSVFTGWTTNACLPNGATCQWIADGNLTATATFKKVARLTLLNAIDTIMGPVGPPCASVIGVCRVYDLGTMVQVGPQPSAGNQVFIGWDGVVGCAGSGVCLVNMDQDRTLTAMFGPAPHTVTPSAGANGTISPSTPLSVATGATATFVVTPSPGHFATVSGTCGGTLVGNNFTTQPVTADCTVIATFSAGVKYVVTTTAETGPGSWRDALFDLNNNQCAAASKRIEFNIPAATDPGCTPATAICVVQLEFFNGRNISCPNVVVDGYTQPGAIANSARDHTNNAQLKIEFAGTAGLAINHDNVTVRGIAFASVAVNLLTRQQFGVGLVPTYNTILTGNYFGWRADGRTAVGGASGGRITLNNGQSVNIGGARIGGPNAADRNLITYAALGDGVTISGSYGAVIEGNIFNLDRDGNAVNGASTNQGIASDVGGNDQNIVRRNIIANTRESGIKCTAGSGGTFTENEIYNVNLSNQAHPRGIEMLAVCNNNQAAPVITSVVEGANVNVQGTLTSVPNQTFKIEFFHNATPDAANIGRGEQFVGFVEVTTNASGQANVGVNLPAFVRNVSATATRLSNGDSSRFSALFVPPAPVVLSVFKSGGGQGVVSGSGINCGATCTSTLAPGSTVTLTATPEAGSIFSGWTGGCTNTSGTCTLTLGTSQSVTATFLPQVISFTVTPSAGANGSISPQAQVSVVSGTTTAFTVSPSPGFVASVGGSCGGSLAGNTYTTLPISADCNVAVLFSPDTKPLTVTKVGRGTLFNVVSSPSGIFCGATCNAYFDTNSSVNLSLGTPSGSTAGLVFTGWSGGGCSGTGSCTVMMDAAKTVSASFESTTVRALTVVKSGPGSVFNVVSSPAGIACGTDCNNDFALNSNVTLSLGLASGSTTGLAFAGWSGGGCAGTAPCTVTLDAAKTVTANFVSTRRTLTVDKTGRGAVFTVVSSPAGVFCGTTCDAAFDTNSTVTLSLGIPSGSTAGLVFTGWSGGGCSGTGSCTVTMDAAKTVSANFESTTVRALTVAKSGPGNPFRVISTPGGIACGTACSSDFALNSTVTLSFGTPSGPTDGLAFTGWSGGGCTGTAACTVTMDAAKTVTANFVSTLQPLNIVKSGPGNGFQIVSSPNAIDCGATCSANFAASTLVTLGVVASGANPGAIFSGWTGGGCAGTGACTVTMDAARTVTANFVSTERILSVVKSGPGAQFIVSSAPAGIDCGSTCSAIFTAGASVTLSVLGTSANPTASFAGWSGGGCAGTGTCTVSMDAARTVTATFVSNTLTVVKSGPGSLFKVVSTPNAIDCGAVCSAGFPAGTMVSLGVIGIGPHPGIEFTGWSGGGCAGTGACVVTMDAAKTVTANFVSTQQTLTVVKSGPGGIFIISSAPSGISCGSTCTADFPAGSTVTLGVLASGPHPGIEFAGWSGGGCSGLGACTVTMDVAKTVTANFASTLQTLTVVKSGPGGIFIISSTPSGISCGATCSADFPAGTVVTLAATASGPHPDVDFLGWSGSGCSGTGACTVTVDAARTVTATFGAPVVPLQIVDVVSRKVHGAAGSFDLPLKPNIPATGNVTVEPRRIGSGHQIVFTFNQPVSSVADAYATTSSGAPVAGLSTTLSGTELIVTLTAIPDRSRVEVQLKGVNGTLDTAIAAGFLLGDVDNSRTVNGLDVNAVKARAGQVAKPGNFRYDITVNGVISAGDVLVTKLKQGASLP